MQRAAQLRNNLSALTYLYYEGFRHLRNWGMTNSILQNLTLLRIVTALLIVTCLSGHRAYGQTQTSSLGMELSGSSAEMPFLNILKLAGGWYPEDSSGKYTGEEHLLYSYFLDDNHYPTSLKIGGACPKITCPPHIFTQVSAYPNVALPSRYTYPSGTYVLLYTGAKTTASAGNITVGRDASLGTCPAAGRCLVRVEHPSANGIRLTITVTDPSAIGNYINNIALIYSPDSTASSIGTNEAKFLKANCLTTVSPDCLNPLFLKRLSPFKTFRMMDWGSTLKNLTVNWTDRSLPTWAFWNENNINFPTTGNSNGFPVEAMIAACNANEANCWLNMPCNASDDYVEREARLVSSLLKPNLKVYVEYCNEVWNNNALNQTLWKNMAASGAAAFPDGASHGFSSWSNAFAWGIVRAVRNGATFVSIMGKSRVNRIIAGTSILLRSK